MITQHLTASDLMIGDWVLYRPGWIDNETKTPVYESGNGFPVRLTCIYDGLAQYDNVLLDGINTIEVADFELFPIPLTKEILEKNGFQWTGSGDRTMMCGTPYDFEGIRYNLYVGLGKKYIEVHAAMTEMKAERWRKVNKTYLEVCGCYVHELQHALKLCGIDKEIIL